MSNYSNEASDSISPTSLTEFAAEVKNLKGTISSTIDSYISKIHTITSECNSLKTTYEGRIYKEVITIFDEDGKDTGRTDTNYHHIYIDVDGLIEELETIQENLENVNRQLDGITEIATEVELTAEVTQENMDEIYNRLLTEATPEDFEYAFDHSIATGSGYTEEDVKNGNFIDPEKWHKQYMTDQLFSFHVRDDGTCAVMKGDTGMSNVSHDTALEYYKLVEESVNNRKKKAQETAKAFKNLASNVVGGISAAFGIGQLKTDSYDNKVSKNSSTSAGMGQVKADNHDNRMDKIGYYAKTESDDDSKSITYPDGFETTMKRGGYTVSKYPDGKVCAKKGDHVITKYPNGVKVNEMGGKQIASYNGRKLFEPYIDKDGTECQLVLDHEGNVWIESEDESGDCYCHWKVNDDGSKGEMDDLVSVVSWKTTGNTKLYGIKSDF